MLLGWNQALDNFRFVLGELRVVDVVNGGGGGAGEEKGGEILVFGMWLPSGEPMTWGGGGGGGEWVAGLSLGYIPRLPL